jgi:hypothetical protein
MNYVRLQVDPSLGSTKQTILYAFGNNGQTMFSQHSSMSRGAFDIDFAGYLTSLPLTISDP